MLDWLERHEDPQLRQLLHNKQLYDNYTIAHYASLFPTGDMAVLSWILSRPHLAPMLFEKSRLGQNFLHCLFKHPCLSDVDFDNVWEKCGELQNHFKLKDENRGTIIQIALRFELDSGQLQDVVDKCSRLQELFKQKDCKGKTVVHIAACSGKRVNCSWLMRSQDFIPLLFEEDHHGNTIAHFISEREDHGIFAWLLEDEKFSQLFISANQEGRKNHKGRNVAHQAARAGFCGHIQQIFEKEHLRPLLHEGDSNQQNIAHFAAQSNAPELLKFIAEQESLTYLLEQLDADGRDLKAIAKVSYSMRVLKWLEDLEKQKHAALIELGFNA